MPPLRRAGTGPEAEDPEFAGHYRLESRLGSGGMGVVHSARSSSGLRVAVKVVHAELAEDPEFRARFRQEVAAARRVSGAFTAPVVDADPDGIRPWMATLYIPGPTLAEHVKRNGPLAPDEVVALAAGLAEAMRDIHRADVVHRDLKPSNVLLAADGPKVIDFGISRPADSELRTETGKLIGTPPYMAPEQFQRPRQVGPAADVFALGSVLVHAATGRGPFESTSPYIVAYQVVHDEADLTGVPEQLAPLIRRCLAKEPEERPTPDALMAALRAVRGPYAPAPRVPAQRTPEDRGVPSGADTENAEDAEEYDYGFLGERRWQDVDAGRPEPDAAGTAGGGGTAGGSGGGTAQPGDATHIRSGGADGDPRSRGRLRGRRVQRWATAGLVTAVLAAGGVIWGLGRNDGSEPAATPQAESRPEVAPWRPWRIHLAGEAGVAKGTDIGPAHCSYGSGALYCAARGIKLARINPDDGSVRWSIPARVPRPEESGPQPPELVGGLALVYSTDGTRMEAYDLDSHRKRWVRDVGSYHGQVYQAGDTLFLVSANGSVSAVDTATNKERWRHRVAGHEEPTFFAYGSGATAYALSMSADGSHTLVTALDPVSGTERWHRSLAGNLQNAGPGPGDALQFVALDSSSQAVGVVRYDPAGGVVRRVPLTTEVSAPTYTAAGDTVYLLGSDGGLVAVDTSRTGVSAGAAQRWRLETYVSNASWPVAAGDRLYFSAADGRLMGVDASAGDLLGQTMARTGKSGQGFLALMAAPAAGDGKVFASASDGTVFAVEGRSPARW